MNTRNLRFKSNRLRDVQELFRTELRPRYGEAETDTLFAMLVEAFLGWGRVQFMLHRDDCIDQSDLLRFHWALEHLGQGRPVQYIIGHVDFCGCRIGVAEGVLIPRPETEEMVQSLIPRIGEGAVVDLCTGSGCIAIALKRALPLCRVAAVDVSEEALTQARANAVRNQADVEFVRADILQDAFRLPLSPCAAIVSNPPYVRESERAQMAGTVLDHEPELALFVPDADPLRFHRAIARLARQGLIRGGILAMEINEALGDEVCHVLAAEGFAPTLHHDFWGKARWVTAEG